MVTGEVPVIKIFYVEGLVKSGHGGHRECVEYLRLEIAMHQFMFVQDIHRLQNLLRYPLRLVLLQRADFSNIGQQIAPWDVLHRNVRNIDEVPGKEVDKQPPVLHRQSQINAFILGDGSFGAGTYNLQEQHRTYLPSGSRLGSIVKHLHSSQCPARRMFL